MTQFDRIKLHEICESVKEDYLLNTIEESTNEVEILQTKKFLNETTSLIERILVEENTVDTIKAQIIEELAVEKELPNGGGVTYQNPNVVPATDENGNPIVNQRGAIGTMAQKFANGVANMWQGNVKGAAENQDDMKRIEQARWIQSHPGLVAGGAAGLGAAGYGAYEAMQDPSVVDQASDMVSGMM